MIVKRKEKKGYNHLKDDVYSIKDLIEEKRKEIRELESQFRVLTKNDFNENDEGLERDKLKRQIKRLEKELKSLQREL